MRLIRQRWFLVAVAIVAVALTAAYLKAGEPGPGGRPVVAVVRKGPFSVEVSASGELQARQFVQITAPASAQQADIYQMKIASIVPEGTVVKAGDVVAEIDRSAAANKMQEVSLALQKAQAVYEQAMLDSTLTLSKAREDIRTMELGLEEKRLAMEQAKYEAPTVQRQAEIDLEKATRALAQAKADYETKTEQAKAKMREVGADLERQRNLLGMVQSVMEAFTVRAPSAGMVIYAKEWNGRKRTTGSQVSPWDPGVATLPDLTQMESVTYINEIDIRKVAVGQTAEITLDSDPTKKFRGKVVTVANVGEQRPNTDSKVFEVKVTVEQSDTTLRPGMTTGNNIRVYTADSVLFVPLEALGGSDGVQYVYVKDGGRVRRQEVTTGAMSDDEVVLTHGVEEGDEVLLTPPADADGLELVRLPEEFRPKSTSPDTAKSTPVPVAAKPAAPAESAHRARP